MPMNMAQMSFPCSFRRARKSEALRTVTARPVRFAFAQHTLPVTRSVGRSMSYHGFTLVEVLVALAVLAIALAAVMRAMAQAVDTTVSLREHSVALWVAQNRLMEHEMRQDWPAADTIDGEAEMGGEKWYWREQVSTTPEPKIRRIEITVRRTADSKDTRARLVGYLRNKLGTKPPVT